MVDLGGVGLQRHVGQDRTQEQPGAVHARDEVGVLALPAEAGGLGERLFRDRGGIDEDLYADRASPALFAGVDQPAGEGLERLLDGVVVVCPLRVDRDASATVGSGSAARALSCGLSAGSALLPAA